ncbi:MAG: cysteine desulfurase [Phycisphaeraceae bacterium]|nr:cysteine desulfurase [Phycisphaeraceae bacterium]
MDFIYLDHNATTPPDDEVIEAMAEAQRTAWANPSSIHRLGQQARHALELARARLSELIGCRPAELVLTSGGTESNNLALQGLLGRAGSVGQGVGGGTGGGTGGASAAMRGGGGVLVTSPMEHSAIREPAEFLGRVGARVVMIPADSGQVIEPRALLSALDSIPDDAGTVLVSLQWANNETGAIQPISELATAARQYWKERIARVSAGQPRSRLYFHSDATQAVGKLPVAVKEAGVDLLSFAAHKFYGPRGVGGLFVRSGVRFQPVVLGGPQERERRGGTENVAGIVGAAKAAELSLQWLADPENVRRIASLRDDLEKRILAAIPDAVVHRGRGQRLWNTTNIGFPRLEAEAILLGLSEKGVCVSAGAACSSGSLDPSPVLLAMGIERAVAHGSIRFSLGRRTTAGMVEQAAARVIEIINRLRQTAGVDEPTAWGMAGRS